MNLLQKKLEQNILNIYSLCKSYMCKKLYWYFHFKILWIIQFYKKDMQLIFIIT